MGLVATSSKQQAIQQAIHPANNKQTTRKQLYNIFIKLSI